MVNSATIGWLVFVFGALVGSFLNVVIWRVPRGESVVSPRSYCPNCLKQIAWYDNIPLISWILLGGKCRKCSMRISFQYISLEFITATLFSVAYLLLENHQSTPNSMQILIQLLALWTFACATVVIAAIDAKTGRIPNAQVLIALCGSIALALSPLFDISATLVPIQSFLAGVFSFIFFFAVKLIAPRGIGWGDVKVVLPLGMVLGFFGWGALIIGGMSAFGFASLYSFGLIALKKKTYKSKIYFGPWLVIGTWFGILFGEEIWGAYLNLLNLLVR